MEESKLTKESANIEDTNDAHMAEPLNNTTNVAHIGGGQEVSGNFTSASAQSPQSDWVNAPFKTSDMNFPSFDGQNFDSAWASGSIFDTGSSKPQDNMEKNSENNTKVESDFSISAEKKAQGDNHLSSSDSTIKSVPSLQDHLAKASDERKAVQKPDQLQENKEKFSQSEGGNAAIGALDTGSSKETTEAAPQQPIPFSEISQLIKRCSERISDKDPSTRFSSLYPKFSKEEMHNIFTSACSRKIYKSSR